MDAKEEGTLLVMMRVDESVLYLSTSSGVNVVMMIGSLGWNE